MWLKNSRVECLTTSWGSKCSRLTLKLSWYRLISLGSSVESDFHVKKEIFVGWITLVIQLASSRCCSDKIRQGKNSSLEHYSDSLRAGWSGDRIPGEARISTAVQNGPRTHPNFYKLGTGSFPGVKAAGAWGCPQTTSSAEVKERVQLYLYSHSGPSWPVLGWSLPFPLYVSPVAQSV